MPQLWFVPPGVPDPPLDALSPQECHWGEALPLRRRSQYWRSRALMRALLAPLLKCKPAAVPLHSPPGAPPRLPEGLGWVSLSHGGGAVMMGWSMDRHGVDLEPADRAFDAAALMQRFFPPEEQRQLADLAPEPLRAAVLRSWVAKEAAIKWRHRSLAQELSLWAFDHDGGALRHRHDQLVLQPCEGRVAHWRWACVGDALDRGGDAPLIWPFNDG